MKTITKSSAFRRATTGILLAVGLSFGTAAVAPQPAEAASYVEGCFRSNRAGLGVAGLGVNLQAYRQGSWYVIRRGTLGNSGCVQLNVATSHRAYPLRLVVNHQAYGAVWSGVSPYNAPAGQGRWNVGTGTVYCYGCNY